MLSAPADQLIHPFRATLFANAHTAHRPLHASLELFPAPSFVPEQHKETHTEESLERISFYKNSS